MKNYIVFLRGVNVGGKNKIKMQELSNVLQKIYPGTKTYIQSGNILIPKTTNSQAEIKETLEKVLKTEFSIDTYCFIKTDNQLKDIIAGIPFDITETKQLYFTFSDIAITTNNKAEIETGDYKGDTVQLEDNCIYINCLNGYGKTKLHNNFIEKKLQSKATTRNYNTLSKMILISENY